MTLAQLYADKPRDYFSGARADMVHDLPNRPFSRVLELGCGDGSTGALAKASGKAAHYIGIELDPEAAARAQTRLDAVLMGDVAGIDLSALHGTCDAVIASEVLEHLVDPWAVVRQLAACLKPGGLMLASSPNLAHWRVVRRLLAGQFSHTETGVMDRSHLRWFTPESYAALMRSAGLQIVRVGPITPPSCRTRALNAVTQQRLAHLFMTQIYVVAQKGTGS